MMKTTAAIMLSSSSRTSKICCVFLIFFFFFFLVLHQMAAFSSISINQTSSSSSFSLISIQNQQAAAETKSTNVVQTTPSWAPKATSTDHHHLHQQHSPHRMIDCDRSHYRYDICTLNGPTTISPASSTVELLVSTTTTTATSIQNETIRPYPRKWESNIMSSIKELTLISSPVTMSDHSCQVRHKAPALVFSAGGYTGNIFHDFNDGFIPLFITISSMYPDGERPVLVIANCRGWWLSKYRELLRQFTPYQIVNLDSDSATTHCFPSATVGLISQDYMIINPKLLPHNETYQDFRALIGSAYGDPSPPHSVGGNTGDDLSVVPTLQGRPRLVLVSRTGNVGRVIRNQADFAALARRVGFEVSIFEPNSHTSMREAYKLINGSHAMVGVHGAALTHSLFLRPGSVMMQLVPIGVDWLGEVCYGKPAKDLKLEYMEYRIKLEESSLTEKYDKDDIVLRDPRAVTKEAWSNTKNIYLKNQDVKIDLLRMRKYLKKAYNKAKNFMDRYG